MKQQGLILKRIRALNKWTMREAARKIGRSVGWLCEVENEVGKARLSSGEFERIVKLYDGDKYRSSFGGWIRVKQEIDSSSERVLDGAIFRFARTKSKLSVEEASKLLELSMSKLCRIESGLLIPDQNLKERIMKAYGYSIVSFKNFRPSGSQGHVIPVRYRLEIMLRHISETHEEEVYKFLCGLVRETESNLVSG